MANQTTRSVLVKGDVNEVFAAWADLESFPSFVKQLRSVTRTGPNTTHWVAQGPMGMEVEWDAETTTFEPGKRMAWHSDHGSDVRTSGQVTFNQLPDGMTEVTVVFQHATENLKGMVGKLLTNVDDILADALRHFKGHVEGSPALQPR
jgi:uncharacterized membrane protein